MEKIHNKVVKIISQNIKLNFLEPYKNESIEENCEGHPDGVEHTHEDGTVHTHEGGDKPHTHDEEVEEGKLPPALQKAIDAKKKNNSDDDDEDKSPVGKKDENIANFGDKKAKAFTDDDNPTDNKKKKDKKEDIRDVARRILRGK